VSEISQAEVFIDVDLTTTELLRWLIKEALRSLAFSMEGNLVPRGCIPFGQHQGCKTSGIINVKIRRE